MSLVRSGNLIVNGQHCTNRYFGLKVGDIAQINTKFFKVNKALFNYHQWKKHNSVRLQYLSFLQVDVSMLMFMVVS